ncbi:hypothetical protein POM88_050210 [Heracleum sosnowskyi]|uniref:pyruvate decarboxylase n=1 Tax=Heracleum sosnowskyi TaxID=360622 RepID=A0AAD8GZB2_9APIA|nr:hypothetical protein POM88_050210 [Heracleum sosnowskyi]
MEEPDSIFRVLAQAIKKMDITHVFCSVSESDFTDILVQEDIKVVHCVNTCSAAYAADAFARIKGLGIFVENDGGIESLSALRGSFSNGIPVICLWKDDQEQDNVHHLFERFTCFQGCVGSSKDADKGISDAVSTAVESRSPVFLRILNGSLDENEETTPTKSITPVFKKQGYAACKENYRHSQNDMIDLVMTFLKEYLPSEEIFVLSEIPCINTEFPPTCLFEFGRDKEIVGWSLGATIGYALAEAEKRLITCITDLSFQSADADISTMLRIGCNAIIILLNRSHRNLGKWNYTGIFDSMDVGQLKSWSTRVYTERRLRKAIRIANLLHKNRLCLIEVSIENQISIEKMFFEKYRLVFCDDLEENSKNLGSDNGFCVICYEAIINREYVVSYQICRHVFHKVCVDKMFEKGYMSCPWDRLPLNGPCETWIFQKDEVSDDEIPDAEIFPEQELNIIRHPNIESCCSRCSVQYRAGASKVTLINCSHTFCIRCLPLVWTTCLKCHEPAHPMDIVIVYEEDLELIGQAPVLAVATEGRQENEVNIEAAEAPAWDEEEAHRLADIDYATSEWFWR